MNKLRARNSYLFVIIGCAVVALAAILLVITGEPRESLAPMRILGFTAYLLALASILSALFIQELVHLFGRRFIAIHHIITVTALAAMALHPLFVVLGGYPPYYLLPDFTSGYAFFARSGPVALLLFGAASLFALLRAKLKGSWRMLHWLVYLAFLIASVHAALLGMNLQEMPARIGIGLLGLSVIVIFVLKRRPRKIKTA
ncbi:MAG: hypothetical protein LLG44_11530 [Chloroflexi bacterium]|nr:hypothetical protein [Chloroflexota bacterium]